MGSNQTIGGGEILDHISNGSGYVDGASYLNDSLIKLFKMVPFVKILLYVIIIFLALYLLMKLFNVKSPFKGKALKSELEYMEEIKKRDASIIRSNKLMKMATNIIEKTPLSLNKANVGYWDYNLKRAGVKIPGGSRYMKGIEFNAISQVCLLGSTALSVFILLFFNYITGWILVVSSLIIPNVIPMAFIRQKVKEKDLEIKEKFADMYLMIHHVLIADGKAPLSGILRSYAKTIESAEMLRFIDTATYYMDTYGEYEATNFIAREFREIPEVGKLMRLIKQNNEGGNIKVELLGFREELMDEATYARRKRMEKTVQRANNSFNILMIILIQAILSAMSIYMADIGLAKGLIGN